MIHRFNVDNKDFVVNDEKVYEKIMDILAPWSSDIGEEDFEIQIETTASLGDQIDTLEKEQEEKED